jgi:hypothetical protein
MNFAMYQDIHRFNIGMNFDIDGILIKSERLSLEMAIAFKTES